MLYGLLSCRCCCDCVFSLNAFVWLVLLFLRAVLWLVFALCVVVVECFLFCLLCVCVRLWFIARRCMLSLCVRVVSVVCFMCLYVIVVFYSVMLSGVFVSVIFCLNMCACVLMCLCLVCDLSCDVVCCVGVSFCVCVWCCLRWVCFICDLLCDVVQLVVCASLCLCGNLRSQVGCGICLCCSV